MLPISWLLGPEISVCPTCMRIVLPVFRASVAMMISGLKSGVALKDAATNLETPNLLADPFWSSWSFLLASICCKTPNYMALAPWKLVKRGCLTPWSARRSTHHRGQKHFGDLLSGILAGRDALSFKIKMKSDIFPRHLIQVIQHPLICLTWSHLHGSPLSFKSSW